MFNCKVCGKTSKPREKPVMEVVEVRQKVYPPRPEKDDIGGSGVEIVRERMIHKECA
jgi:hypothetical protein